METERKYSKQVNENGWMRKFQVWCFGDLVPHFVGYCPFFWFTWICVFISPLILFGKIFEPVGRVFLKLVEVKRHQPKRPNDGAIMAYYEAYCRGDQDDMACYQNVIDWIKITPNWEECAKLLIAKYKAAKERARRKKEARERFKARFAKLIGNYGGYIVRPLLFVVSIVAAYYLWRGIVILISMITLSLLVWIGKILVGGLFACLVLSLLFRFVVMPAIEYYNRCPRGKEKPIKSTYFWRTIGEGIAAGATFCIDTVAMLYTRECPLIEWSDKDSSIKRR